MKLTKRILLTICACTTLFFTGCGALDELMIMPQVTEMVKEHMSGQEEILKLYDIKDCSDFKIEPEKEGVKKGFISLSLAHKKTGEIKKIDYEFKYDIKESSVEVGVKNPSEVIKLMNIGL